MGLVLWSAILHLEDNQKRSVDTASSEQADCFPALILSLNILVGTLEFLHLLQQLQALGQWSFLCVTFCTIPYLFLTNKSLRIIFLNDGSWNQNQRAKITKKFHALTKYYVGERESSYFCFRVLSKHVSWINLSQNISLIGFACVKQSWINLACSLFAA